MAIERLSVEVTDNAAAVTDNIKKLVNAIHQLTATIQKSSKATKVHADQQEALAEKSEKQISLFAKVKSAIFTLGQVIVKVTGWTLTFITAFTTVGVILKAVTGKTISELLLGFGKTNVIFQGLLRIFERITFWMVKFRGGVNSALIAITSFFNQMKLQGHEWAKSFSQLFTNFRRMIIGTTGTMASALRGNAAIVDEMSRQAAQLRALHEGGGVDRPPSSQISREAREAALKRFSMAEGAPPLTIPTPTAVTRGTFNINDILGGTEPGASGAAESVAAIGERFEEAGRKADATKSTWQRMVEAFHKVEVGAILLSLGVGHVISSIGNVVRGLGVGFVASSVEAAKHAATFTTQLEFLKVAVDGYNQSAKGAKITTDEWQKFIQHTATSLGLNIEELTTVSALVIDYGRNLNLSSDQMQDLINRVVDLSVGLGTDLHQTFETVIAGVTQYSSKLAALGVDLSEATLIEKGYIDAQKAAANTLSSQELALAKISALLKATGNFQGLATKRADTFNGALAKLNTSVEVMNQNLGKGAQNVLTPFVSLVSKVANVVSDLPPALQQIVGATKAAIGVFLTFSGEAIVMAGNLAKLKAVIEVAKGSAEIFGTILPGVIAKITGFTLENIKASFALEDTKGKMKILGALMKESFSRSVSGLTIAFSKLGTVVTDVGKAILASWKSILAAGLKLGAIIIVASAIIEAISRVSRGIAEAADKASRAASATKTLTAAQKEYNDWIEKNYSVTGILSNTIGFLATVLSGVVKLIVAVVSVVGVAVAAFTDWIGVTDKAADTWKDFAVNVAKSGGADFKSLLEMGINPATKGMKHLDDAMHSAAKAGAALYNELAAVTGGLDTLNASAEIMDIRKKLASLPTLSTANPAQQKEILEYTKRLAELRQAIAHETSFVLSLDRAIKGLHDTLDEEDPHKKMARAGEAVSQSQAKIAKLLGFTGDEFIDLMSKGRDATQEILSVYMKTTVRTEEMRTALQEYITSLKDEVQITKESRDAIMEKMHANKEFMESFDDFKDRTVDLNTIQREQRDIIDKLAAAIGDEGLAYTFNNLDGVLNRANSQFRTTRDGFLEMTVGEETFKLQVDKLNPALRTLLQRLYALRGAASATQEATDLYVNTLDDLLKKVEQGPRILTPLGSAIEGATQRLQELAALGINLPVQGIEAGVSSMSELIAAMRKVAQEGGITDAMKEKFAEVVESFAKIEAATDTFAKTMSHVIGTIRDAFETHLGDSLYKMFTGQFSSISDAFNAFVDDILRGISRIAAQSLTQNLFSGLANIAPAFFAPAAGATPGLDNAIITNVPQMAEGGVVRRPTPAIIGEAGPEAVIPLEQLHEFGGSPVNITVVNAVGRPEDIVGRGIAANPNIVLNPVFGSATRDGRFNRVLGR